MGDTAGGGARTDAATAAAGRLAARSDKHPSTAGLARSRSPRAAGGGGAAAAAEADVIASSRLAGGGGEAVVVVGESASGPSFFHYAFMPMDDEEREQSRAARWDAGRQQAESLVADAIQQHGPHVVVARPWLELSKADFLHCVHEETVWVTRGGSRAYIGSTSDPGWRWRGGRYLGGRSGRNFLPGHHLEWRSMLILGCWRDPETALMERDAIAQGRKSAPGGLTNIASDSRGLEIRPYSFSFVSTCLRYTPPPCLCNITA